MFFLSLLKPFRVDLQFYPLPSVFKKVAKNFAVFAKDLLKIKHCKLTLKGLKQKKTSDFWWFAGLSDFRCRECQYNCYHIEFRPILLINQMWPGSKRDHYILCKIAKNMSYVVKHKVSLFFRASAMIGSELLTLKSLLPGDIMDITSKSATSPLQIYHRNLNVYISGTFTTHHFTPTIQKNSISIISKLIRWVHDYLTYVYLMYNSTKKR